MVRKVEISILIAIVKHSDVWECVTLSSVSNHIISLYPYHGCRKSSTFFFLHWKKLNPVRCCRTLVAVIASCSSSKRTESSVRELLWLCSGTEQVLAELASGMWKASSSLTGVFASNSFRLNKYFQIIFRSSANCFWQRIFLFLGTASSTGTQLVTASFPTCIVH